MELQKFTATGSGSFEIDVPSEGVLIKNIAVDATLRIDFVGDNVQDQNRFPELSIKQLVALTNVMHQRSFIEVLNAEGTAYDEVFIPFTKSGVIRFNEENRYRLSFKNLNNRSTTIYNVDSLQVARVGHISIVRNEIKSNLTDSVENVAGVNYIFFPTENPQKIEMFVTEMGTDNKQQRRKVTISPEQLQFFDKQHRITTKVGDAYKIGNDFNTLPVSVLSELTIHKEAGKEFIYYAVKL